MWIEDLSPLGDSPRLFAVGWLARGHEYPIGEIPMATYKKLAALLAKPWQAAASGVIQPCSLCLYEADRAGTMNLFVPGEQRVYVAPELILHYLNAHHYRPPEEFCTAVVNCPTMGTPEYRQALLTAGGPGILRYAADFRP
jgi:hypothetical protein